MLDDRKQPVSGANITYSNGAETVLHTNINHNPNRTDQIPHTAPGDVQALSTFLEITFSTTEQSACTPLPSVLFPHCAGHLCSQ